MLSDLLQHYFHALTNFRDHLLFGVQEPLCVSCIETYMYFKRAKTVNLYAFVAVRWQNWNILCL